MWLDATGETLIADNLFEGNVVTCDAGWAHGGAFNVKDHFTDGHGRKYITRNRFIHNRLQSNSADNTGWGGALELYFTTTTITANLFLGNEARHSRDASGGAINADYSAFTIDGNVFDGNVAQDLPDGIGMGGALQIVSVPPHGGEQVVASNLFSGNSIRWRGGAIGVWDDQPDPQVVLVIANNTIVGNRSQVGAGGVAVLGPGVRVFMNNILWDNQTMGAKTANSQVEIVNAGQVNCHYNDIEGGWLSGVGNINVPPGFLDSSYSLSDTSACLGAGIDSVQIPGTSEWFYSPRSDLAGSLRPNPPGSRPDIGALENVLAVGSNQPALLPDAFSVDFRNVQPGIPSDTVTLGIFNRAEISRSVLSVSLAKREFRTAPSPALPLSVPPYQTVEIGVAFTPSVPGVVVLDTLVVETDDRARPRLTFPLRGRGSASPVRAEAGMLYAVSNGPEGSLLHTIDKSTGAGQVLEPFSPVPLSGIRSVTLRHRDSTLYGAFESSLGTDLYRLSISSGDLELAGRISVHGVSAMAFDTSDMLLLADSLGELYRWRMDGSEVELIGSIGFALTGLAFNPATGALWGSLHDSLFTVDIQMGSATCMGVAGQNVTRSSIAFSQLGTLYGLFGGTLVNIDKITGRASIIGLTNVPRAVGLAMRSDIVTGTGPQDLGLEYRWDLSQNYPNPFNPTTVIRYEVAGRGGEAAKEVRLVVYDLLGRAVVELVNERQLPGSREVTFDASRLSSGVYVCRLTAGSFAQSRRMLFIK